MTAGGDTYRYAYGRGDQNGLPVIEEITRVSGTTTSNAYVAHDPSGQPVLLQTSTGTVSMYVYNGQNEPVGLSTDFNAAAYSFSFDPHGTATVTYNSGGTGLPQNPYVFGTGVQDRTTGLVKFGQRWYDPATGTWTQQDALNAPLDPGNANRYNYAAADPINGTDPTGQCDGIKDCAGTGALIGTGVGAIGGALIGGLAPSSVLLLGRSRTYSDRAAGDAANGQRRRVARRGRIAVSVFRKVGQYLGLIYRDDGRWQPGRGDDARRSTAARSALSRRIERGSPGGAVDKPAEDDRKD